MASEIVRFYRANVVSEAKLQQLTAALQTKLSASGFATRIDKVTAEFSYYIQFEAGVTLQSLSEEREYTGLLPLALGGSALRLLG